MAILRLANGTDITVTLSVDETIATLSEGSTASAERDFVELPGDDGPIHIRPSGVIAIVEDRKRHTSGFRFSAGSNSQG